MKHEQFPIQLDPEKFIYTVDYNPEKLAEIFKPASFKNPNLNLIQLTFLEIVSRYDKEMYDWKKISKIATETNTRDYERLVNKLAERIGVPETELKTIIPKEILVERNKNLKLPESAVLYTELKASFDKNNKDLKDYRMYDFYLKVIDKLDN